jgi:hypothetical protein
MLGRPHLKRDLERLAIRGKDGLVVGTTILDQALDPTVDRGRWREPQAASGTGEYPNAWRVTRDAGAESYCPFRRQQPGWTHQWVSPELD